MQQVFFFFVMLFSCKIPLHFNGEMVFYNCQESPSKNFENILTRPEILQYLGAALGARGSNDLAYLFDYVNCLYGLGNLTLQHSQMLCAVND